ncbi:MAG: amidohydrolase family protein [Planctomycetaceae bacterium]
MKFASAPLKTTTSPREASPENNRISRRGFEALLAAGAACLAMPHAAVANTQSTEWIDAHVHVWTPDTKRYPLAQPFQVSDMQPPSFTAEQLFAHSRPAGVGRIVLIQMSFYGYDNSYMLDTMAAHPGIFSGVAIVDPQAAHVAEQIRELSTRGVRGLRIHPGPQQAARWTQDEAMSTVWKAAGELGIAICLLINPSDLPHVDAMCAKFPGVRVVIDHFARVGMSGQIESQPLETLCRLSRFPDVFVKTSAFYALGKKQPPYVDLIPMIRRLYDSYGAERLMWASDCPYQVQGEHTYEESIALIRDRIDFLTDDDKQSLLRGTAERVFFSPR